MPKRRITMDPAIIDINTDQDGYSVDVLNLATGKSAAFRLDKNTQSKGFTLYRVDRKPTKRTHSLVDVEDMNQWFTDNEENFAQAVV